MGIRRRVWLGDPARNMVPRWKTLAMRADASRQPPSPSSELTPPLPVLSLHPALAGPRGMGAGETELAGWGDVCGGLGGGGQVGSL